MIFHQIFFQVIDVNVGLEKYIFQNQDQNKI